jgi:2-aminobenzoate-CoA ligase
MLLGPSGHVEPCARNTLPQPDPDSDLPQAGFDCPDRLNSAVDLTDRMVKRALAAPLTMTPNWTAPRCPNQ